MHFNGIASASGRRDDRWIRSRAIIPSGRPEVERKILLSGQFLEENFPTP